jgi:hypothetical protein
MKKTSCLFLFLVCSVSICRAETPRGSVLNVPAEYRAAVDFEEILFVKRKTFKANHYYTEHINSHWLPGGGLYILNLKTGEERKIETGLPGGVYNRYDLSFDAEKIVFSWKAGDDVGYRIYEVNVDGTALTQLTFPVENEAELVEKYSRVFTRNGQMRKGYHHGTDDMAPCYLPDGGIAFISTRVQYGILCDGPDIFTTSVLYRMDADGSNMKKLTNSSVSENSPSVLPDGRILYTRWEYLDKGSVAVKALWAMKPDGSASSEIYGANVALPPTFIYGRAIPGAQNQFVVLGAPHFPQNAVGTVIRLDMSKNIRSREPMTYMTPTVDIRHEGGFHFNLDGKGWGKRDKLGKGPLFKDPYPLSKELFLVSHKQKGPQWREAAVYDLHFLTEDGAVHKIYDDPDYSCWMPIPLKPRKKPPMITHPVNEKLAAENKAVCVVSDVYHGMEGVPRGAAKYLRILEQVPRPWAARRHWMEPAVYQEHATISKNSHLGLKVQHGIVPIEEDGSAHFFVPANANISFQVLDKNYMSVQTERTYVNYMPGEQRSCIGCHETPDSAPKNASTGILLALKRPPSVPQAQPGDPSPQRIIDFTLNVQPVLDRHCVRCHGHTKPSANLNLSGTLTDMFSIAFESLSDPKYFAFVQEHAPKHGNAHYLPPYTLGAHNSLLGILLYPEDLKLTHPKYANEAERIKKSHAALEIPFEDKLKITNWLDTNGQFYGMYWGRKQLQYKDHPNFRPVPTFERAVSCESLIPEKQR